MADLDDNLNSNPVRLVGSNELHAVDVILEDGAKKMMVKSTAAPQALGNRFSRYALNGGSKEMDVKGDNTTVVFTVEADAVYDMRVSSLIFDALDGGVKLNYFMGLGSKLSNGIVVEIKSQDIVFSFLPIITTTDFNSLFSYGPGRSFDIIYASGPDSVISRFGPQSPFLLKKQGIYATDDYIKIFIQDDLRPLNWFRFIAEGVLDV